MAGSLFISIFLSHAPFLNSWLRETCFLPGLPYANVPLFHSGVDTIRNRPLAGFGHMVRSKLHWDANDAVGLSKQRKVGLAW